MSTSVIILRAVSLLAFAGPMLLVAGRRRGEPKAQASREGGGRTPVVANLAAFGLFFPSLLIFAGGSDVATALPLALSGCLLALAGAALVLRSRAELGPAWSLVPKANQDTGLVTTGPYRLVRHPVYLGLALLAMGEALAFGSWPAFLVVLFGIGPTFAWRAHAEEELLSRAFGEDHEVYRRRTKMIIPHVFRGTDESQPLLPVRAIGHSARVWTAEAETEPSREASVWVGLLLFLFAAALLPLVGTGSASPRRSRRARPGPAGAWRAPFRPRRP